MPYSTTWEPRGVMWTFWGVVTGEELFRSNGEVYGDPRFDDITYELVDLTGVDRFDVTEEDMLVMAASDRAASRSNANVRIAVAANDPSIRAMSERYSEAAVRSPWQQRVFTSVEDARNWLEDGVLRLR